MSDPDYWAVFHADHALMNPFSIDRLLDLGGVLRLGTALPRLGHLRLARVRLAVLA